MIIEAFYTAIDLSAAEFDHTNWEQANPIQLTRYWSGVAAPSGRQAEARILWSEESLCVRFVCQQNEPLVVNSDPQSKNKALGLWNRDVCEIFLAPDPAAPNRYFEFEAAPTGEWIDLAIHKEPDKRETDWEFHSGMTAASRIAKDHIIIALRIPWGDRIHKPQRGERWRANLFRCIGSGKDRGYLAWQPTRAHTPDFHIPEAFGWLVFAG